MGFALPTRIDEDLDWRGLYFLIRYACKQGAHISPSQRGGRCDCKINQEKILVGEIGDGGKRLWQPEPGRSRDCSRPHSRRSIIWHRGGYQSGSLYVSVTCGNKEPVVRTRRDRRHCIESRKGESITKQRITISNQHPQRNNLKSTFQLPIGFALLLCFGNYQNNLFAKAF